MPLPTDEKLLELSDKILQQFDTIFGLHPGFRPAHAKGTLLSGVFTSSPKAAQLTRAPHAVHPSTPVSARLSNSTGLPLLPDTDPNANPRGLAVRFHLGERRHTDIISHATNGFPVRTGDDFLEFLRAVAATPPGTPSPNPIESFLAAHPETRAFVQTPKPTPTSFARERYFGVTAMRFTNAEGTTRHGRFQIVPADGTEYLQPSADAGKNPDFLFAELAERIATGLVVFDVLVQLAGDGDVVNDATAIWPDDRPLHPFGRIVLDGVVPDDAAEQKRIIFDPIPRVDGIDPSDDPLLELRAAIYLLSGRRRRAA